MKCPGCGKVIDETRYSADLIFCPHCGEDIKAASAASQLHFCPYCGQKQTSQSNFCPNCGKKLMHEEKPAAHAAQPPGESFMDRAVKPIAKSIRNSFGRERQINKLYKQWAEFSNLPPDEVPSMDDLRNISSSRKNDKPDSEQES